MKQEISISKIRIDAEEIYAAGGFFCSEAIVYSVRKNIDPDMPEELIAAGSGFPIGVGGAKCLCGAVSGAVICLGYFFGRTQASSPADPKSQKSMELASELQEVFRKKHKGVLCCHVHLQSVEFGSAEHIKQCVMFTGEMAEEVAKIIARELGLTVV